MQLKFHNCLPIHDSGVLCRIGLHIPLKLKECNMVAESLSRATNSQLLTKWEHILTFL